MTKKVLLFGDMGIDDTIAIIYAYLNDEIDIIGIVADYGNVSRIDATSNIYYLFSLFDLQKDIPIYLGAAASLTGEKPVYYPEIHGEHGLGPIVPKSYGPIYENFFEIVELIKTYKDELIIVNVGRLTSLATLFILYKNLMNEVKDIFVMGGAFWVPGNITTVAEANFHADPIAVNIVLTYASNVTIIPLNATQKAIVTPEMVDYIDYFGKAKIIKPLMGFYDNFYKKRNPTLKGSPVHDVLPLVATIHPELFTFKSYPIQIVQQLEGPTRGQCIVDIRPYIQFKKDEKKHRIAFDLNYEKFFYHFINVMTGKQK